MSDNKKGFNTKLYATIVFFAILAFLVVVVTLTFESKYISFHPETVAENYVDNIVQKGDGYDAYKYTLMSKNSKFGDFVVNNYMEQYVNKDAKQSALTSEDDGAAKTKFYDTMYKYYVELLKQYGYDDYDSIFSNYFKKAVELREEIYGDKYITTDILFGAFEANVATYGDSLAGTPAVYDKYDEEKVLVEAIPGEYNKLYGNDYIITVATKDCAALSADEMKAYIATMNEEMLKKYEISKDDIAAVDKVTVEAKLSDGKVIATQEVHAVQIGKSWYVDNTTVDTSALYNFYK